MCKCHICGNTKDIVYTSLLDGNVCKECKDKFFVEIDGDITAKLYNKPEVMDFITSMETDKGYSNLVRAIKDVQQRYTSCIINSCVANGELKIDYKIQFKGRELLMLMTVDKDKTQYKVSLENNDLIQRVFE